MVSHLHTVAFQGIEAVPVNVQVMVAPGKMNIHIVGLPDKAVAESRERVQAALHASGLSMPVKKVTVNLAPADLPKEGSHYDLPIALGLMAALGAIPGDALDGFVVLGELALDGTIAPVAGALPAAMGTNALGKGLICPHGSGPEAAWAGADIDILAPKSLIAVANHFRGTQVLSRPEAMIRQAPANLPDLADIKGQETAKRALEVGECMIARANHRVTYPARIQLVAAMNPCRCGMAGEPGHRCACGTRCAGGYQARISGPLLDRIDLRIEVPAVSAADLIRPTAAETSASVAERVARARVIQADRYAALGLAPSTSNARCPTAMIEKIAAPDAAGLQLLHDAAEKLGFSARAYHRVLKVARTLVDLDAADAVGRIHLAEAVSYRIAGDRIASAA